MELFEADYEVPAFGEEMREKEFCLGKDIVNCNQGSYGVIPRRVLEYRFALLREVEACADIHVRLKMRQMYDDALEKVGAFVGADPKNIVFVSNATVGCNSVMKSFDYVPEDVIFFNSHTYGAIANTADCAVTKFDADTHQAEIHLPMESEEEIVNLYVETCARYKSIKMAVVDYVTSCSGIMLPVKKITKRLRDLGVLVLVDAAHAPGQVRDLNIEDIDADFFVGNLHKWAFAPRGCGVLWVHPRHQGVVRPLVTGWGYRSSFQDEFFNMGTTDMTNYLCAPKGIEFLERIGGLEAATPYITELLDWAADMLATAMGTSVIQVPKAMNAPFMRTIALPDTPATADPTRLRADRHTERILERFGVMVCITAFAPRMWVRIGGHVYSQKKDYEKLRDTLLEYFEL